MHFNNDMRFACQYWMSLRVGMLSGLVRCCEGKGEINTLPLEASRAAAWGQFQVGSHQERRVSLVPEHSKDTLCCELLSQTQMIWTTIAKEATSPNMLCGRSPDSEKSFPLLPLMPLYKPAPVVRHSFLHSYLPLRFSRLYFSSRSPLSPLTPSTSV
jgi:hypothetical protein